MAATLPQKLRDPEIVQFAHRAAQLEQPKPIIAYWLRFYITQKIIGKQLHLADPECTVYTTNLMEKLEQTKAEHATEDALLDEVAAYAYCEQFALEVFARGDNAIKNNSVSEATVDTFRAAATFFEMLTIWKNPLDDEIKSKIKYAKFHTLRIARALKAGEDPNASNPVAREETHQPLSPALDPNDPDVQRINGDGLRPPQTHNPYQSYVESAPNTDAQPSPTFSASRVSPPPKLPSAPTGYSQHASPPFPPHRDVSPISQPDTSRQGSVTSVGGGYFPRVDVPTFTSENAAPSLPTAPSTNDEPMTTPFENASLPSAPAAEAPPASNPQSFYENPSSPPPNIQPQQQHPFQHHQSTFTSPLPPPPIQQQPSFEPPPLPQQHQYQHPSHPQQPQPPPPQQYAQHAQTQPFYQGPFKTDEEAVIEAQKHAKWAISALNFEDVDTAVKELRIALRALGAI